MTHRNLVFLLAVAWLAPTAAPLRAAAFRRGDANADGTLNLTDPVFVLLGLFAGGGSPACLDAADANDDGALDLADAVHSLNHLFHGAGPLAPPFDGCGSDPTQDELGCASFAPCGPPALVEEAWVARRAAGTFGPVWGMTVDGMGNVFVQTESETIKYDAKGSELWTRQFPIEAGGGARNLAVEGAGNAYVTGYSRSSAGSPNHYLTVKYDPDGRRLWLVQYKGPQERGDGVAEDVAIDDAGNAYVTGQFAASTGYDFGTVKYDTNGNQLWAAAYNGPGDQKDVATHLAIDGAGYVYVAGSSFNDPNAVSISYATLKYDMNGNELWAARSNEGVLAGLAIDSAGGVYVAGGSLHDHELATVKYDAAGNELWIAHHPANDGRPTGLAVDGAGNVYLSGRPKEQDDYMTIKYDTSGTMLWEARYGNGQVTDVSVDKAGDVYVTGELPSGDIATLKYDATGNQLWLATTRFAGPCPGRRQASAAYLTIDLSGNVYVAGGACMGGDVNGNDVRFTLVKYVQSSAEDREP